MIWSHQLQAAACRILYLDAAGVKNCPEAATAIDIGISRIICIDMRKSATHVKPIDPRLCKPLLRCL